MYNEGYEKNDDRDYNRDYEERREDNYRDSRYDDRRDDGYRDSKYDDRRDDNYHDDRREDRRDDNYRDDRRDERRDDRRDGRHDDFRDDRQIREEIDRLRREIYTLKDSLENRRQENSDLKMAIKQAEKNNAELLAAITQTLQDVSGRVDKIDEGMEASIKKLQTSLHDDIDELNMPMEAKCEAIDERLKTLQENLDYAEPMKETMEAAAESMRETLAERFGSKTIGDVLQKLASLNTFMIADSIGIVVLLGLMCFFIISLMR